MKYIIEIEDEPFGRNDDPVCPHGMDELWRAKGFRSLTFDKVGLSKLMPYVEPQIVDVSDVRMQGYLEGVEEGWGAASYVATKHGLPDNFFDKFDMYTVIDEMRKSNGFNVGDEVECGDDGDIFRGVLIDQIDFDGGWYLISEIGCVEQMNESQFHKTGKKYDAVIKAVKELGAH